MADETPSNSTTLSNEKAPMADGLLPSNFTTLLNEKAPMADGLLPRNSPCKAVDQDQENSPLAAANEKAPGPVSAGQNSKEIIQEAALAPNTDQVICGACPRKRSKDKECKGCPLTPYFGADDRKKFLETRKKLTQSVMKKVIKQFKDPITVRQKFKEMIQEEEIKSSSGGILEMKREKDELHEETKKLREQLLKTNNHLIDSNKHLMSASQHYANLLPHHYGTHQFVHQKTSGVQGYGNYQIPPSQLPVPGPQNLPRTIHQVPHLEPDKYLITQGEQPVSGPQPHGWQTQTQQAKHSGTQQHQQAMHEGTQTGLVQNHGNYQLSPSSGTYQHQQQYGTPGPDLPPLELVKPYGSQMPMHGTQADQTLPFKVQLQDAQGTTQIGAQQAMHYGTHQQGPALPPFKLVQPYGSQMPIHGPQALPIEHQVQDAQRTAQIGAQNAGQAPLDGNQNTEVLLLCVNCENQLSPDHNCLN